MRKASKAQPPSYWVQLLYEQVERAREERELEDKPPVNGVEED